MAFFDKIKAGAHGVYKNVAESVMPTLKESKFLTDGVLTPAEFVAAGDLLVHKCPTWTWESAEEGKAVPYLPNDKQFLLTRNVPCLMRLKAYEGQMSTDSKTVTEGEEEWCAPTYANNQNESQTSNTSSSSSSASSSTTVSSSVTTTNKNTGSTAKDDDDSEDIPDMEEFDDAGNLGEAEDRAAVKPTPTSNTTTTTTTTTTSAAAPAATTTATTVQTSAVVNDNIKRTRTYDIGITYDKYYQTPKLWLFGYDENRQPLRAEQMFEDIASDYSQKTVTIENFPHKTAHWAFIHPCRHAEVMKRLVERQLANNKTPRPDQYLFLFLKFISAVIPCIEYDNTNNVEL